MKYMWMALRLLLAVAAIVLLALAMMKKGETPNWLLSGGLLCSTLGLLLSIWCRRKEGKDKQ